MVLAGELAVTLGVPVQAPQPGLLLERLLYIPIHLGATKESDTTCIPKAVSRLSTTILRVLSILAPVCTTHFPLGCPPMHVETPSSASSLLNPCNRQRAYPM